MIDPSDEPSKPIFYSKHNIGKLTVQPSSNQNSTHKKSSVATEWKAYSNPSKDVELSKNAK